MKKSARLCLFFLFAFLPVSLAAQAADSERSFSQFIVTLPPGWDGDEQSGFVSDDSEEYALTLGKKDAEGDSFVAQVTIYLLPNKPGADAKSAAEKLTEAQGDATKPVKEGNFWVFSGEPRSRAVKGMAKTLVNADKDDLLIIIAQDPQHQGAEQILASLKGNTPKAKKMLGQ